MDVSAEVKKGGRADARVYRVESHAQSCFRMVLDDQGKDLGREEVVVMCGPGQAALDRG